MKKLLILLIFLLFSFPLFADAKNIVYNNSFDFQKIDSIDISLTYENLKISQIYGDEIVVEIGSNNKKKIPEVLLEQDELNCVLTIASTVKKSTLGNSCTVYLYLPQDFLAEHISISLVSGNLQSDILKAQNALFIKNISGRTDIAGCSTDYLSATAVSGNLTIQKIATGYFDINNTSGNIFLELENKLEAKSRVTSVSGKIQIYYKKDCFASLAITNKKNESPFLDDSSELLISTVSGKVESVAY